MPTIKLPAAGEAIRSGTVRKWLKGQGDAVGKGDAVVELDTEGGVLVVESPVAGRLSQVLVGPGKTVAVHGGLGIVEADGGQVVSETKVAAVSTGGNVIPILMPKAGQSMEEGTIIKWRVGVGANIKKGEVIFEVETDKANMDVEAQDSGRLAKIIVGEGGTLGCLLPVAYLAESDGEVEAFLGGGGAATVAPEKVEVKENKEAPHPGPLPDYRARGQEDGGRVKASPAARKIAAERGIELASVPGGSGPGGRILSTDIPLTAQTAGPAVPAATGGGVRRKLTGMRKAIAKSLLYSKQSIPHFYVRVTVDAGPSLAFYQAQKALYPCSINDVIVLACARLMKEFPAFRSRLEGEEIIESGTANIGIAVGMDEGLVVPVITAAERLSLSQLAGETRRLATSARAGKIEGMGTGSFTITNLGMFGTEEFAAIINPPECAILAVGAAREAVVVRDGALKAGKLMTMTLSADHRIIDGMLAAKFVARLKEILQAPEGLAK